MEKQNQYKIFYNIKNLNSTEKNENKTNFFLFCLWDVATQVTYKHI